MNDTHQKSSLRRGWTTGACATAATKAALNALVFGEMPSEISITLPKGQPPRFEVLALENNDQFCECGIIKDAGDDPDVTHGALIKSRVNFRQKDGGGILFHAGQGVGIVTLEGLPIDVGEAAINPVPRDMMRAVVADLTGENNPDIDITISVDGGRELALKTWNPRLGIEGGISILGTTGIVVPYSCAAWINSIHRGIDVARALGLTHVVGATGKTSEATAKAYFNLTQQQLIDMGDFAGGMLKYIRKHPVEEVTIVGGFAKITKLAQGHFDLHSARSQIDFQLLSGDCRQIGVEEDKISTIAQANTALHVLSMLGPMKSDFASYIAQQALQNSRKLIKDNVSRMRIMIIDRQGSILAEQSD